MLEINELNISNPFSHKSLLPRQERIKPLVIPTQREYDLIMSEYSMNDSKKALLAALAIITKYGVRISAFHKASVLNHNLVRITDYKGKEQTIAFESRDIGRLKSVTRHYKTRECLEVSLINFLKKCHKQGLTDNAYSPHDFRHLFACNFYKTTKDIVGLSVILNHTSIAVTDTYITDLKRSGNETRTIELVPSISEYNQILTKYKAYRKIDINTALDALYFISRYEVEIDDFYTTKTYAGNTVQLEREFATVMVNIPSKDMKRLERVTRH
jgi:hypothetical protein